MKTLATLSLLLLCAGCGSPDDAGDADASKEPVAAATVASTEPPVKGRLAPRNDCSKLAGADGFRQALIEAVQLRDTEAVVALADPAIKLDFGGGGGVAELRQQLPGPGAELWKSLEQLLQLGCASNPQGNLVIPWVFAQDLDSVDTSVALLVTGEDVPVLTAPRASTEEVTRISWEFVSAANGMDRNQPYTQVTFPLKQHGYIATDKLRSVLDYRLLAAKRSGEWRIEALVRGD
jgi:hypothetical protein